MDNLYYALRQKKEADMPAKPPMDTLGTNSCTGSHESWNLTYFNIKNALGNNKDERFISLK